MNPFFKEFRLQIQRERRLAYRHRARCLESCLFFLIILIFLPLSIPPTSSLLSQLFPGMIWMGFWLASLLSWDYLWIGEFSAGILQQVVLSPHTLYPFIWGKYLIHWISTLFPMILLAIGIAPVMGVSLSSEAELGVSLLLGSSVLNWLSCIGSVLALGLAQRSLLIPLLVFPWYLPVLILGTGVFQAVVRGTSSIMPLELLGGLSCLTMGIGPGLVAHSVRVGVGRSI